MKKLPLVIDDGGRSNYFVAKKVGDCVIRAFAIAAQRDYKEVYDEFFEIGKTSPRNGVKKSVINKYAKLHGYEWVPLMKIGSGCRHRLAPDEIPMTGRIVCSVSRHCVAVIDGVIHDTYDCTRDGRRCVYGYWIVKQENPTPDPTPEPTPTPEPKKKRSNSKRKKKKRTLKPINIKVVVEEKKADQQLTTLPKAYIEDLGKYGKRRYDKHFWQNRKGEWVGEYLCTSTSIPMANIYIYGVKTKEECENKVLFALNKIIEEMKERISSNNDKHLKGFEIIE